VEFLNKANLAPPLSEDEVAEMEKRWPEMSADDPLVRAILYNPLAERWHTVRNYQPRFAEVLVTDASGRLVAATNKSSDYYQADEPWWQQCYANGEGHIFLSEINWDESAVSMDGSTGAVVATLCVPIRDDARIDSAGKVVGVMKVALDAAWLLQDLARLATMDDTSAQMWLVQQDGRMVPDGGAAIAPLPPRLMETIRVFHAGWTWESGISGKELLGFAQVQMPQTAGNPVSEDVAWYVIVAASRKQTLGPVYRLAGTIATGGAGFIVLCFAAGFLIARREVVRPLMELSRGAGELERGNIGFRLTAPPPDGTRGGDGIFRHDEIGQLAGDFNRMAAELERLVGQLKQASEMKQQFIDLASHELRTPVTYILGMSELAQRQQQQQHASANNGSADVKPMLEKISSKAQRLRHIVDNMFKLLSGRESYHAEMNRAPVDLRALVARVQRELDPFLEERHQQWDVSIADDVPILNADEDKLHDVLVNLLSNAIRFSPDGQRVGVRARRVSQQAVEIVVTDRGGGIARGDLPHLFEPFYTAAAGELMHHQSGEFAHRTRGLGLGLSVVKRFVELHGGTVAVASSPQGSEFTVRLPIVD
jgi:signal transduction histidine kinase